MFDSTRVLDLAVSRLWPAGRGLLTRLRRIAGGLGMHAAPRSATQRGGSRRVRVVHTVLSNPQFPLGHPPADSAASSITWRPAVAALSLVLLASSAVAQGSTSDRTTYASQPAAGRIVGRVIDGQTGQPVEEAQVAVLGTELQTRSDLDGRYIVTSVPAGSADLLVRRIGFTMKTVTGVSIAPGETTTLDVSIFPVAVALDAYTVTAEAERGTTATMLDVRRTSEAVVDAVGLAEIQQLSASDAADVAQRMTGVTVNEGRYVYVRGLGDRYSQTSLNGSPLPSPEPERSVVPLDLFPADFLETVAAQKTYTPDQPAEFSGGTVRIETKEFPDRFRGSIGVGTGLNTVSHFRDDFLTYPGGDLDFLGIDDGTRALPDRVGDLLGGLRGDRVPSDPAIRQELGVTFPRTFTPSLASTPLNRSVDLSLGTRALVFGRELGLMAGVTYADDYSFRNDEIERKYRASSFDPDVEIAPNVDYTFDRGTRNVRLGAIANVTMLLSPTNKVAFQGTFTRNTDDEARTYWGRNREDLDGLVRSDRLRFVARELYWGQLSGEHQSFWDSRLEWRATLARAARDEPGLRETIYLNSDVNDSTAPAFLENVGESGRYLWSELRDDDRNLELDWRFPFDVWSGLTAQVKVGGAYRDRQRDFAARRFNWSFYGGTITNIDSALSDTSIVGFVRAPGQFALTDVVEPGDLYAAFDDRRAGYLMLELPLARGLRTIVGARLEDYHLLLDARGDTLAKVDRTDVLPALNAVMELSPSMNLRLAASQTVDRPEFREVAPFQFTEAASLRQLFGNPALTSATVRSLDLRWDWFRRPGELISISGFYKHLDEPIEQVFITAASTAYSFQNAESATLYGLELDVRQRLDALSWSLQNLIVQGNLSLIHSNVRVIETGNFKPTSLERPLEGQADYALNVGMLYQSTYGGTEVGVFLNRLGERVTAAGGFGTPDIVEQARNQLDVTFKQRLPGNVRLKLKASNLLNAPYRFTQEANGITVTQREYEVGTSVSVGLSYEF